MIMKKISSGKKDSVTVILGLDPGTATTGWGVISTHRDKNKYIAHGCIETPAKTELPLRLDSIAKQLTKLIRIYKPDLVSVEEIYFYSNTTTAISVAQARGVLLQIAAAHHLPVHSYTPLQVKQALTGYGNADKRQIQKMITIVLGMEAVPASDDAADALAIAVTCAHSFKLEGIK